MTNPVIVALDYSTAEEALTLADQLSPKLCRLKVGKELFTAAGPALVDALHKRGYEVFLDLKFHDIPNTVAGALRSAAALGVWMVNVHAAGGRRMLEAAVGAVQASGSSTLLIGVTVLTSMSDEDLKEMGYTETAQERVLRLAALCQACGLDGVVCSAAEAPVLREQYNANDFCLVTPGIRMAGDSAGDQRRVVTPARAMSNGSSYLVIGRSITGASDPLKALEQVHLELGTAL